MEKIAFMHIICTQLPVPLDDRAKQNRKQPLRKHRRRRSAHHASLCVPTRRGNTKEIVGNAAALPASRFCHESLSVPLSSPKAV